MSKKAMEMQRGTALIHVVRNSDGTYTGDDVYNGRKKGLTFRNYLHLKSFASKHNYVVTPIGNT